MNTKITVGVLAATTILFGFLAFKAPTVIDRTVLGNQAPVVVPTPVANVTVEAPAVTVNPNVTVVAPKQTETPRVFGSVSSPDIMSPYFSVGGVRIWASRLESLIQASTTVCAIQAPNATSTLMGASIRFEFATSSAVLIDFAKSNTPAATTTKIGSTNFLAGSTKTTLVASSTLTDFTTTLFSPNQWLVVKMQNGIQADAGQGTNNAPVGICNAMWREI